LTTQIHTADQTQATSGAHANADWASLSVNADGQKLVADLLAHADQLGVSAERGGHGALIIDAGVKSPGSVAAGVLIARICMGGLGHVQLARGTPETWPTLLEVSSSQPVIACLASQYAGWSLSATKEEAGGKRFFALGSVKEALFEELGYRDRCATGVLVLEVKDTPPDTIVAKVLHDCALAPGHLSIILTPTTSRAGTTQVVARVLEVALHKAHVLGFNLADIVEGTASAPLPPPSPDGVQAMGRTNDAILYGGRVHLTVKGSDAAARALALKLPSSASPDFGRPFADVFREVQFDFYKIDPGLFAPAEVWVSNLESGNTWHAGALDMALLHKHWLGEA
jgi:methenyltetrahydromethanopterin cyclohydrolase